MAKSNSQGFILHCGSVMMNISGDGELITDIFGLGGTTKSLPDWTLSDPATRLANVRANFKSQKINVRIGLDDIHTYFQLNQINIFVKPVSSGYPQ